MCKIPNVVNIPTRYSKTLDPNISPSRDVKMPTAFLDMMLGLQNWFRLWFLALTLLPLISWCNHEIDQTKILCTKTSICFFARATKRIKVEISFVRSFWASYRWFLSQRSAIDHLENDGWLHVLVKNWSFWELYIVVHICGKIDPFENATLFHIVTRGNLFT